MRDWFVKRFEFVSLAKRYCKNWLYLVTAYLIGNEPEHMVLRRDNLKIAPYEGARGVYQLLLLFKLGWFVQDCDSTYLLLGNEDGMRLKCRRNTEDVESLIGIYEKRHFECSCEDKIVVDVGMNNGDTSIYFAMRGARLVIGLEPFGDSYRLARENIELNKMQQLVIPVEAALASYEGEATLLSSFTKPTSSSLLNSGVDLDASEFGLRSHVRTTTLRQLTVELGLERIDILKLNCEGCEFDVLPNMPSEMFEVMQEVVLQVHGRPEALTEFLASHGFEVRYSDTILYAKRR